MSAERAVPHDLSAEQSLLGAMMLSKDAIATAYTLVDAGDFYSPGNGTIYDQILALYRKGEAADSVTVADALRRTGLLESVGGPQALAQILASTPATTNAGTYARIVVDHATMRRIAALAEDLRIKALEMDDPGELLDMAKAALGEMDVPLAQLPEGVWSVDSYLERPDDVRPPWVIPGLFRKGWRCVIVAEEGVGKTAIAHQVALCAAQGMHPFARTEMEPVTTLLVDLENPDERIMSGFEMVTKPLVGAGAYERDRAWLWHQEGGINVRQRADRGRLEAVIAAIKPDLVCIGPIYKLYAQTAKETDEQAARECMAVLDDLRTRYGFAQLLEHHAPKKQAGYREMTPYGSSLWLRWPEFGLALKRDPMRNSENEHVHYLIGRFRHDRVQARWPDGLSRGANGGLPWVARWDEGQEYLKRAKELDGPPAIEDEEPF